MKSFGLVVTTLIVVILIVVLGGLAFIYSGIYNVAATEGHGAFAHWLLDTTSESSIEAHAEGEAVTLPTGERALQRGYAAYESMCVVCHGAPGVDKGWMGEGLSPRPPRLDRVAGRRSPEEIYWVLKNGLKFTGMPALGPTHSEENLLELTAFVEQMADMTPEAYAAFATQAAASAADTSAAAPAGDGHDHVH